MNNKLVKIEVWTSLLKQEAGGDDCLEMSNRCVIHKMGVNQEATPHSLEIEKQGKDLQETEVRRKTLERTPSSLFIKLNTTVSCWHRFAACFVRAEAKTGRESVWNWSYVASANGHPIRTQTWMNLTAEDCGEAGGAGESSRCWPASNCSKVSSQHGLWLNFWQCFFAYQMGFGSLCSAKKGTNNLILSLIFKICHGLLDNLI